MPRFSIIVPVYNTEKYIDKCLSSIENQTYDNYEVIIVNDGTKDNSRKIIDKYLNDEKFKVIDKENGGLSDARNVGISAAVGDYLIFLDSDDYISYKMLEIINNSLEDNIDILKFQCKYVYGDVKKDVNDNVELTDTGSNVLIKLISIHSLLEPAWLYAYKRAFWIENDFKYEKGIYHEDAALTPYIISQAKKVKVINDNLYYYVQVQNSITRNTNYEKTYKKVYDMYKGFNINYKNINGSNKISDKTKKIVNSYLANMVIKKGLELNKNDRKEYYKMLKNNSVYNLLLDDTIKRKIKKIILKINTNLYFKLFK